MAIVFYVWYNFNFFFMQKNCQTILIDQSWFVNTQKLIEHRCFRYPNIIIKMRRNVPEYACSFRKWKINSVVLYTIYAKFKAFLPFNPGRKFHLRLNIPKYFFKWTSIEIDVSYSFAFDFKSFEFIYFSYKICRNLLDWSIFDLP